MKVLKYVLIFIVVFAACKSSYNKKTDETQSIQTLKVKPNPPNTCRIFGTIISIDENFSSENADDPCRKAPCLAIVRVDSILGYGQGFIRPLAKGKTIEVSFKFTLGATEALFPNMQETYPGLNPGDSFMAEVGVNRVQFQGQKGAQYYIYGYEKIN